MKDFDLNQSEKPESNKPERVGVQSITHWVHKLWQRKWHRSSWLAVAAIAQAIFSGLLFWVANRQERIIDRQTTIMKGQLLERRLEDRAWIEPHSVGVTKEKNGKFELKLYFGNIGKLPARNVKLSIATPTRVPGIHSPKVPQKVIEYSRACALGKTPPEKMGTVYPSGAKSYNFESSLPAGDIGKHKGTMISGCFLYSTERTPRYSTFCFYWSPANMRSLAKWSNCQGGNSAD